VLHVTSPTWLYNVKHSAGGHSPLLDQVIETHFWIISDTREKTLSQNHWKHCLLANNSMPNALGFYDIAVNKLTFYLLTYNCYIWSYYIVELTNSLINQALWCVPLSLQVTCRPVTVYQLPVPINENGIPAVVWRCTGDWCTRLIVHTFCPSRQCHAVQSRVAVTITILHRHKIAMKMHDTA